MKQISCSLHPDGVRHSVGPACISLNSGSVGLTRQSYAVCCVRTESGEGEIKPFFSPIDTE